MTSSAATDPQKLFTRLYVSLEDLRHASSFAGYLLKKGLHFDPWERRWPTYVLQSAFTSSLIIFYSRPFTKSFGLPDFPANLLYYSKPETALHRKVLELRHQGYAHSDGSRYRIKPVRILGRASAVVGAPFFKLTRSQTERLQRMIGKTMAAIEHELEPLMNQLEKVT